MNCNDDGFHSLLLGGGTFEVFWRSRARLCSRYETNNIQALNPDGGHTYLITFPMSMGNVPEMKVFMTDMPVSISTVEEGNELDGSFRLG